MTLPTWKMRFLGSTRGQILAILRRGDATVNELAQRLGLTDNAVRTHLAGLERDGLVEQRGVQRGIGKPAYVYRLTSEADALFPKAYALVLDGVLETLREREGDERLREVLIEVGKRLAERSGTPRGDLRTRVRAAADALNRLGGLAEVVEENGSIEIQGYSCPLSAVAGDHPPVCQLAAALLTELVGTSVEEACERGERPRCRFLVRAD